MIEVYPLPCGRWAWRMISAVGRVLVDRAPYPCDGTAIEAARQYRTAFNALACGIDDRMGAAI